MMSEQFKKFIVLPLLLIALLASTFFLAGCSCSVQGRLLDNYSTIINKEELKTSDFKKLIGADFNKENGKITGDTGPSLLTQMFIFLLGSVVQTSNFSEKLDKYAEENSVSGFSDANHSSVSFYSEGKLEFNSTVETKELSIKFNITKKFKAPNDWSSLDGSKKIKIKEIEFKLTLSANPIDSEAKKYDITVKFTNLEFKFNEEFAIDNSNLKAEISIKKIEIAK